MKTSVNEIFGPTIQGEGIYAGTPSVFIRLNGCNLRCYFKGSMCDTPYTSHHPERIVPRENADIAEEVVHLIEKIGGDPENSHIVITGGEPMLQQQSIVDLIGQLEAEGAWNKITIETNGTIVPQPTILGAHDIFWSVSPKLSTSCCFEGTDVPESVREAHNKNRINLEALAKIVTGGQDYQLKFVYSGPECVKEIEKLISDIKEYIYANGGNLFANTLDRTCDDIDRHVMLMPEGTTNEQISKSAQEAVEVCIEKGWKFCDRLHIRIWSDKRAV